MTRPSAGHDEDRVDADIVAGPGITRRKALGGGRDPAKAIFVERQPGRLLRGALLDLDERKDAATSRDQVDLATGDAGPAGDDRPAVEPEPPRRDRLRAAAARFGGLTGQSLAPRWSARA